MLTAVQHAAREGRITASFVPALIAGNAGRILNEWFKLIGDPRYAPENLDNFWPAHLGNVLEPVCLDWHERKTQCVLTRRGEVVVHPSRPYLSCTLDAWREDDRCVLDVKVCSAHRKLESIVAYYTPQMVVQRACTGADRAALLLCHGGAEPEEIDIMLTPEYEAAVLHIVDTFWACVETLTPPVEIAPPPPPPERWRKINLDTDSPNWGADLRIALESWAVTYASHEQHEVAKRAIKALLPDDVGEVIAGRYRVSRAKNRAVSIRAQP